MPRKPLIDLQHAIEAVDYLADCGLFDRKGRPAPTRVARAKSKLIREANRRYRTWHPGRNRGTPKGGKGGTIGRDGVGEREGSNASQESKELDS
jgi:hypothetical protein